MIAAEYLRKSRAEENEPLELTLARHRQTLEALAASQGITVAAVYEEVASGDSLHARPQMLKLLDELDKYDAIICVDIDRLGRGAMHEQGLIFESIRQAGLKIVTPLKTYDLENDMDDSLISFKALFAREEYKIIRSRLRRGILKSIEEGCYVSNAPYGYEQIRINKKPSLAIVENEAEAIRLIYKLYTEGQGCQRIADTLHSLGYRPRRGDKFNRTSIAKILRNPVYTGKVIWNQRSFSRPKKPGQKYERRLKPREEWIISDGLHDAIISDELYERANRMLEGKYHPPYRQSDKLENPLAGVLFCKNCGKSMVRQPLYNKPHNQPIVHCPTSGCCMASGLSVVEAAFYAMLEEALETVKSGNYEIDNQAELDTMLDNGRAEITRLSGQLSKLHDLLEQGVYDVDTFIARREDIESRIFAANDILKNRKRPPARETLIKRLEDALESYWSGSASERNRLVKSVVARAVYSKPKGSRWYTNPVIDIVEWRS